MHKSIQQRSLNEDEPYFKESELKAVHENAKTQFLSQVSSDWNIPMDSL